MLDTVGGEMQTWIDIIKKDAVQIGSKKLAEHICELEYYVLALSKGVSIEEDSGVATYIMETKHKEDSEKWLENSKNLITNVGIVNHKENKILDSYGERGCIENS